jgi:hypothetical protein
VSGGAPVLGVDRIDEAEIGLGVHAGIVATY